MTGNVPGNGAVPACPESVATEAVPRYASWAARVGAGLVDLLFGVVIVIVVSIILWALHSALWPEPADLAINGGDLGYADEIERSRRLTLIVLPPALLTISLLIGWNLVFRQGRTGQSLGKQVAGIRVVDGRTGRPVGFLRALGRQLAHTFDALPCWMGFFWPLWDRDRQTFADKVAATVVVRSIVLAPPPAPEDVRHSDIHVEPRSVAGVVRGGSGLRWSRTGLLVAGALICVAAVVAVVASTGGQFGVKRSGHAVAAGPLEPVLTPMPDIVDMAITPDGRQLYLAMRDAQTVRVLSTATNTISATIDTFPDARKSTPPVHVVAAPDGGYVYVAGREQVATIDTRSNRVVRNIDLPDAYEVQGVAVSPDSRRVYVEYLAWNSDPLALTTRLSAVNTQTGAVLATTWLPTESLDNLYGQMAMSRDGAKIYLGGDGHIMVVSTATNTVVNDVSAEYKFESNMAASADGRYLYVSDWEEAKSAQDNGSAAVIDTISGTVVTLVKSPDTFSTVLAAPSGNFLFVLRDCTGCENGVGAVEVFRTDTWKSVETIGLAIHPKVADISRDGRHLYVTTDPETPMPGSGGVVIVDVGRYT